MEWRCGLKKSRTNGAVLPQEVNVLAERMDKPQPATPHLAVKVESHQSFTTMGFWRAEVCVRAPNPTNFAVEPPQQSAAPINPPTPEEKG